MRTINTLIAILFSPLMLLAQQGPGIFTIRVETSNSTNAKVYLVYQTNGKKIIDSASQSEREYKFSGTVTKPLDATLINDTEHLGIRKILKSAASERLDYLRFYIHAGVIIIRAPNKLAVATFGNSPINTDNERLKMLLKPITDRQLELSNQLRAGGYIVDMNNPSASKPPTAEDLVKMKNIGNELDSLKASTKPVMKKFIDSNPGSYIALVTLAAYTPTHPDVKLFEPMFKRLSPAVRSTELGREYLKSLMDIKNLVVGTNAPEFTQKDTLGKLVSLSSFKGKYVLIDFWASWCTPCRAENPALVKLFNEFKDKNFTILGVSLDDVEGKAAWLKAIKDDGLTWTQVSDLKHWDNEVSNLYSIRAIPDKFLIDPNGIIIARSLNVEHLEEILAKVLLANNDKSRSN